jgi:hypothetical protein
MEVLGLLKKKKNDLIANRTREYFDPYPFNMALLYMKIIITPI